MNKIWKNLKKISTAFILAITISLSSLLGGCFSFDEDGESVADVLYGLRVTYSKANYEDGSYNPEADEEFAKSLQEQYLNLATEILLSLANEYGKGIDDLDGVIKNVTTEYGQITLTGMYYTSSKNSESNEYAMITKEDSQWAWASTMNVGNSTAPNKYASEFCNRENLFKMQLGLYLINMGTDCYESNYGNAVSYFNLSQSQDTLLKLANHPNVTHSGLIASEQKMLVDFILNNVIANNASLYQSAVTEIVKNIFEQTNGSASDGTPVLKYQVVASVMVKDYAIKEIAVGAEKEENSEESETDNEDFFTMEIGHQFYKSLVFMPKTNFRLNEITLLFESTKSMNITIYVRLHEKNSKEYLINEKAGEIQVQAGKYDDVEEPAEFEFSLEDYLKTNLGITEYYMEDYNKNTDVGCYGGMFGTGIGDSLFDKYGRALKVSDKTDDITLANLYKVTKNDNGNSVAQINFEKLDSCYLEFVFETDVVAPFNIGFMVFDYELDK